MTEAEVARETRLSDVELHELRELLPRVREIVEADEKASWLRALVRQYMWRACIGIGAILAFLQVWEIVKKKIGQ